MAGNLKCFEILQLKVIHPGLMNLMDQMNEQTGMPRMDHSSQEQHSNKCHPYVQAIIE